MTKIVQLSAQTRAFSIDRAQIDTESRTLPIVFATETPCPSWHPELGEYMEVLDCTSQAVDLTRLQNGIPFLSEHNRSQQIGRCLEVSFGPDRVGRSLVKFSRNQKAEEEYQDILDGIRSSISVSYQPREFTLEGVDQATGLKTYRVTRWELLENSLVSVPADPGCRVGRSAPDSTQTAEAAIRDPQNLLHQKNMTENPPAPQAPQAPAPPDITVIREQFRKDENKRLSDIGAVVDALKRDGKDVTSKSREFIEQGRSADEFRVWCLENAYNATPVRTSPVIGMSDHEAGEFSVLRAINQLCTKGRLEGLEKEASEAAAKAYRREAKEGAILIPEDVFRRSYSPRARAQNVTTATAGGFLVGTEVGPMIELLRNKTVLGQMGAQMLGGLVGNVAIPKHLSGATAYWVSETGALTDSQSSFGQLTMTPRRLGATVPYSTQFLAQTSIDAENFIRTDLMKVLAIEKDRAGLHGTGANGEPLGVQLTTGINQTVTFGGAATWADAVEFETGIEADNADVGSMGFILSTGTKGRWKTILKDSVAGAGYLIEGNTINGYQYQWTNQVAGNIVFFGVWSQAVLASWAGQEVIVDPYALKKQAQVEITINELCDFGVRQPLAFNVSTDAGNQ